MPLLDDLMGAERLLQSLALRLKQNYPRTERLRFLTIDAEAHDWDGMPPVFPASVGTFDAADQTLSIMDKLSA